MTGQPRSLSTQLKTYAVHSLPCAESRRKYRDGLGDEARPREDVDGSHRLSHAMLNPLVAWASRALILALLTRMALLSLADLSFVLPVTAIGYVISVFIGKLFLHETITHQRWLGTMLIFSGAVLVGTTSRNTTR